MEHDYAHWGKSGTHFGSLCGRTRRRTHVIQGDGRAVEYPFRQWKAFSGPQAFLEDPSF